MKQLTILFSLLLICQIALGQDKSIQRDDLLFEKGLLLQQIVDDELDLDRIINSEDSNKIRKVLATDIKETILEEAHKYYEELIDSFPKSEHLYRALNNKGFIELALDDNDEAKKTFDRIF